MFFNISPKEGWIFSGFNEIGMPPDSGYVVSKDITLEPKYKTKVKLNTLGEGYIFMHKRNYDGYLEYGEIVYVEAVPSKNNYLYKFAGDLSGHKYFTEYVASQKTPSFTALFRTLKPGEVCLNIGKYGKGDVEVIPDKPVYNNNDTVRLKAKPYANHKFHGWSSSSKLSLDKLLKPQLEIKLEDDQYFLSVFSGNRISEFNIVYNIYNATTQKHERDLALVMFNETGFLEFQASKDLINWGRGKILKLDWNMAKRYIFNFKNNPKGFMRVVRY